MQLIEALLRNGFTIAIIPAILRHEYIHSLERAHEDKSIFFEFIADRVLATQTDLIRLLKDENDTVNDTVSDTVKHEVSSLSKTENAVFAAIRKYPSYSYEQFADYCGFSRPTIARTIKFLQSKGLIRRVGSDKTGHWSPAFTSPRASRGSKRR